MKLKEKLLGIQAELNAPKGQFNSFGNYHYRSTEDILGAVKPLLKKYGAILTIEDDIKLIGDRYYVQATAVLYDTATDDFVQVTGYAREAQSKKGMEDSQLTGATSSYARKYALNGLFAIDDIKDADYSSDKSRKVQVPRPQAPSQAPSDDKKLRGRLVAQIADEALKQGLSRDQLSQLIKNTYRKASSDQMTLDELNHLLKFIKGA